jgi:hypothetical protein
MARDSRKNESLKILATLLYIVGITTVDKFSQNTTQ